MPLAKTPANRYISRLRSQLARIGRGWRISPALHGFSVIFLYAKYRGNPIDASYYFGQSFSAVQHFSPAID